MPALTDSFRQTGTYTSEKNARVVMELWAAAQQGVVTFSPFHVLPIPSLSPPLLSVTFLKLLVQNATFTQKITRSFQAGWSLNREISNQC